MAPRSIYTVTVDGNPEPVYIGGSKIQATKILIQEQAGKPAGSVHLNIEARPSNTPTKTELRTQGTALRKLVKNAMNEPTIELAGYIEGGVASFATLVREQAKA